MSKHTFTISKNGDGVNIESEGFHGESCLDSARKYMERLGEVVSTQDKPERFEEQHVTIGQ